MLLCQVVEKILPLGRNMWEQVTSQFNANRTRSAPERDLESLKRKFKSLYVKPKPTGQGEVSLRLKPVIWAKELQQKIESEGGVHTTHDGHDQGGDDAALQEEVDEVAAADGGGTPASLAPEPRAGEGRDEGADEGSHDANSRSPAPAAVLDAVTDSRETGGQADHVETRPQVPGVVITSIGSVDATLAALYDISEAENNDEDANDSAEGSTQELPSQPENLPSVGDTGDSLLPDTSSDIANRARPGSTTPTPHSSRSPAALATVVRQQGLRSSGRPRAARREPLPTVASPEEPTLRRDPRRAGEDAQEVDENQILNVASNRLGGQDLRVFTDNVATMTINLLNDNGKRPAADGTPTTTASTSFAKDKRVRAKKRIVEIQREIDEAERRQSSAGADLMRMMLMLQKNSDRRAEAEEARRRADRDERFEADGRERAEREQIRRDEAERRQEDLLAARELR
jgi:hypothetical protein